MDVASNVAGVNTDLLDQQLRAAVPAVYSGCSTAPSGDALLPVAVRVHLLDSAQQSDIDLSRVVVQAHDPTVMTAAQQSAVVATADALVLLAKVKQEAAYFAAVPAADLMNGAALGRVCVDFSLLLLALSVRLS